MPDHQAYPPAAAPANESPALREQRRLVEAMRDPRCYPHPVDEIRIVETHISFVVLTGEFAYKIKKSVDLGFLDFTSLDRRRFFCEEELRLNARAAPELYLAVVPVCGSVAAPSVGGGGAAIEYAVKMREFAQQAQADRVLARGELTAAHIDALAARIAAFHLGAPGAGDASAHGTAQTIGAATAQNFEQMRALGAPAHCRRRLEAIAAWSRREHRRLRDVFAGRRREGWVRECHGDLHLGNIVLLDAGPLPFDCIEFEPQFRCIDVINDIAFLIMDLQAAGQPRLAARLLSAYLESTGDYAGLRVLRYYLVYRAMVRAKIALLRARQLAGGAGAAACERQFRRYLALAARGTRPMPRFVAITHGLSGSGKTTLTQPLLELSGAIRIRSDVERKRLHGLAARQRGGADIGEGLYGAGATEATYRRLRELAQTIIDAGFAVIVDATFLQRAQRDLLRAYAAEAKVAFAIVACSASEPTLRARVVARHSGGEDASDAGAAVLAHQLRTHQPLQRDELPAVFAPDASGNLERAQQAAAWAPLLERLGAPAARGGGGGYRRRLSP